MCTHVGSVRDELAKEDVLVAVQGVDDDVHQTRHLSLELVLLGTSLELLVLGGGRPAIIRGERDGARSVDVDIPEDERAIGNFLWLRDYPKKKIREKKRDVTKSDCQTIDGRSHAGRYAKFGDLLGNIILGADGCYMEISGWLGERLVSLCVSPSRRTQRNARSSKFRRFFANEEKINKMP